MRKKAVTRGIPPDLKLKERGHQETCRPFMVPLTAEVRRARESQNRGRSHRRRKKRRAVGILQVEQRSSPYKNSRMPGRERQRRMVKGSGAAERRTKVRNDDPRGQEGEAEGAPKDHIQQGKEEKSKYTF